MVAMARRRSVPLVPVLLLLAAGTLVARRLGYGVGGRTVVRCRQGHLSTTIWIPGVKLKGLDLVVARVQRCPVGPHWSVVTPVRDIDLTEEDRRVAAERRDVPIP